MDNQNYENKIGRLISENMDVEWMRFNMYDEFNIYASVPMLVFRINEGDQDRIRRLKEYVFEFEGHNRWSLFICPLTRKKNYILSIEMLENLYNKVAEGEINNFDPRLIWGEEKYKKVCNDAVQEIPELAEYLDKFFTSINT